MCACDHKCVRARLAPPPASCTLRGVVAGDDGERGAAGAGGGPSALRRRCARVALLRHEGDPALRSREQIRPALCARAARTRPRADALADRECRALLPCLA
eukprot:2065273-Pleurochrysis_carterae.AAC.1